MSSEQISQDEEMNEPEEALDPEVKEAIAKIKQPPSINETLMQQDPDELVNNPSVTPPTQSLNDPGGTEMKDQFFKQDI
jgi:hypothetical protein